MYSRIFGMLMLMLLAMLVLSVAVAQQNTLTNADIVAMVKAELSEEIIIGVIQRSVATFDISAQSLIALKDKHVPEKVIQSMVNSYTPSAALEKPVAVAPRPAIDVSNFQLTNNESSFLWAPFVQGATVTVKLDNRGHDPHRVTIQPWLSDGSPRPNVSQTVPPGTTEVRIDMASETPTVGWIQVTEEGHSIDISATYEHITGDTLTTIPMLAVLRHPLSEDAVRAAFKHSIHHRYTYDVFALRGVFYVFVNLSDYPVQAGICQDVNPDCVPPSLPYTVQPHARIVFPIDRQKRFLVMHSTPGYSVATGVYLTEGMKRVFTSNSSITFGLVK
jgi:hypothetical protein